MFVSIRTLTLAAAGAIIWSGGAHAASDPTGLWFDHNGRGAVEIAPCANGKGLCGYVVHIKEAKNNKRCGLQILGNVTPGGGGWIYSPERGKKYSVALTRLSDDQLRVVGNAGSFFSKTFTWTRAPDDVARCGETTAAAPQPAKPVESKTAAADPVAASGSEPASTRSLGASSASVALMGAPRMVAPKRQVAAASPEPIVVPAPVPAVKPPAPAKRETAPEQTATAPAPAEDESFDAVPERKCKFKIPYVGRVISVPCRD